MLTVRTRYNLFTRRYQATVIEKRRLMGEAVRGDAGEHPTRQQAEEAGSQLASALTAKSGRRRRVAL